MCDLLYESRSAASRDFGILSYRTLYRILMGQGNPSSETLATIASKGVNLNWLLTGSGSVFAADAIGQALQGTVVAWLRSGQKDRSLCPPELERMIDLGTTRPAGGTSDETDTSDQPAVDDHRTPRGAAHPRVAATKKARKQG